MTNTATTMASSSATAAQNARRRRRLATRNAIAISVVTGVALAVLFLLPLLPDAKTTILGIGVFASVVGAILAVQVHDRELPSDKAVDLVSKLLGFGGAAAAVMALCNDIEFTEISPVAAFTTVGVIVAGLALLVLLTRKADRDFIANQNQHGALGAGNPAPPVTNSSEPLTTTVSLLALLIALAALAGSLRRP